MFRTSSKRDETKAVITLNIGNYYDRFSYYKKAKKNINKINKYQCLIPFHSKEGITQYNIDNNNLTLIKPIGSKSKYGLIYLSIDNTNLFKFAVKLTPYDISNADEIKLVEFLSDITLKDKNPHFLLSYKYFVCDNKNKELYTSLPVLIKSSAYFICINELVSGNLKDIIYSTTGTPEVLLNAYQQILLSILSFHYFTNGIYHNDCHYKNFLFYTIKPGGYFHYKIFGKDIYIENIGFIWMIWDYGLIETTPYYKNQRLDDYMRITEILFEELNKNEFRYVREIVKEVVKYSKNYKQVFGSSDSLLFEELFKINGLYITNIPKQSKIINKKPYVIK